MSKIDNEPEVHEWSDKCVFCGKWFDSEYIIQHEQECRLNPESPFNDIPIVDTDLF